MIHVRSLVKDYGSVRAVDHIDLDVAAGQIVGILGPNGAGKSTTLRILTGFLPPTAGGATVNGHDILTDSRAVRCSLGYLPESTPLYPEMTVRQQLHHFGRLHGLDRPHRRTRIDALAERCGLNQILDRPIGHLSKGNRQRAGLAQALLHDPPLLILDEPTAGLDPNQIAEVRALIQSLAERKTILLSTHILPEVEKTCGRVAIIHRGRVVADGSPEELTRRVRARARVILEARAAEQDMQAALAKLPGVGAVTAEPLENGWSRAAVSPSDAKNDLRADLGRAAAQAGWAIRELRPETTSLEEYFVQITGDAPEAEVA